MQPNNVRFSSDIINNLGGQKKKQDVKHIKKKFNSLRNIFIKHELTEVKLFSHTKARKKSITV